MIFAHTLALVLGGQKSQTRRPMKLGETFDPAAMRVLRVGKRTTVVYQVGKTYAVQPGRGKKSVARIALTGLRQEPVAAISLADAQAEGFASPEAYWQAWRTIHGAQADLSKAVWVLEFRVVSVVGSEMRGWHETAETNGAHRGIGDGENVSTTFQRVSGAGLYGRDYPQWGMGEAVPDTLSLSATREHVPEISMD